MIGNDTAARAFEREFAGKIFRYVNYEDPVPLLPSVSLVANAYAHCQREVDLKGAQAVLSAIDALKQSAGTAIGQFLGPHVIDKLWNVVQNRISAHFIDHYQERVKLTCQVVIPALPEAGKPAQPVLGEEPPTAS
jgi:hypothetical protein